MNKTRSKMLSKKNIILALLALFFVFAFLIPMLWPDKASSEYSGIKKEIAQFTVATAWKSKDGIEMPTTIRITAESVVRDMENSQICNMEYKSNNQSEEGNRFLVRTTYRSLFGIKVGEATYHICRI